MELETDSLSKAGTRLSGRRIATAALVCCAALAFLPRARAAAQKESAKPAELPRVFSLPAVALAELRRGIATGKITDPALEQLRKDADAGLAQEPLSVTQKSVNPPSGDNHDYMSQAPYWWPDPAKPHGLPYLRRDGETNPEIERLPDHRNLSRLIAVTHTLGLAYYLLGDEACAARASELLRVWFLDPKTRMNPNLQFAQNVPGRYTGRGTGLIETHDIYQLVDAVALLHDSKSWSKTDQARHGELVRQVPRLDDRICERQGRSRREEQPRNIL